MLTPGQLSLAPGELYARCISSALDPVSAGGGSRRSRVHSAFKNVRPQTPAALKIRWTSPPVLMKSGDLTAFVHAEHPKDLEFLHDSV